MGSRAGVLGMSVWVPLWHGWGLQDTPLVSMKGLQLTALFLQSMGSGSLTTCSDMVLVMILGGGAGADVTTEGDTTVPPTPSEDGGRGWVGSVSGLGPGWPAPARLDTD